VPALTVGATFYPERSRRTGRPFYFPLLSKEREGLKTPPMGGVKVIFVVRPFGVAKNVEEGFSLPFFCLSGTLKMTSGTITDDALHIKITIDTSENFIMINSGFSILY